MNDEIKRGMPLAEYLVVKSVSAHALNEWEQSPQHCKRYLDGAVCEQTDAMLFGQLLHSLVLEGKVGYVVQPATYTSDDGTKPWHNGAKACKAWVAEQILPIVSASEHAELNACAIAVRSNRLAMQLLESGEPEVSLFAECPKTGLQLKTRLDWLRLKGVVDLKSTTDASTPNLSREIANRRYHVQAAMNLYLCKLNGLDCPNWHVIGLEKGEHPMVNVRLLSEDSIAIGRMLMFRALEGIAECMESNVWPGYCDESRPIERISIPEYAKNQAMGGMTELVIGGEKMNL